MTRTAEQIVSAEVHYCVSSLVSTLAPHWGAMDLSRDTTGLADLFEQAGQLASPLEDWEEAAIQAGWRAVDKGDGQNADWRWTRDASQNDIDNEDGAPLCDNAQEACEFDNIEPYQREVFEHWIVSDWLADKLIEKGEKVDKDFAGMTVWARTTTGQAISMDYVIEQIVADLVKEYGA